MPLRTSEAPDPLPEEVRREIGRRLGEELARVGVSQSAASRAIGTTRAAVSHWCVGRNMPTSAQLVRLAVAYPISIDYVLTGKSPEAPAVLALARRIASLPQTQLEALLKVFAGSLPDERVEAAGYRKTTTK